MYFSGPAGNPKNNSIHAFGSDAFPGLLQFCHVHFGTRLGLRSVPGSMDYRQI